MSSHLLYSNKLPFILVWFCFPSQYMHTLIHIPSISFYWDCSYWNQLWFLPINIHYSFLGFLGLNNIKLLSYSLLLKHSVFLLFVSLQSRGLYSISMSYSFSVSITKLIVLLYLVSKYWSFSKHTTYISIVCPLVISLMLMI